MENVIQHRLRYLLALYAEHRTSGSDETELFALLNDDDNEAIIKNVLEEIMLNEQMADVNEERWQPVLKKVLNDNKEQNAIVKTVSLRKWIAIAAVITGLLIGAYFIFFQKNEKPALGSGIVAVSSDVEPGGNKAILTLADGSTVILDSAKNGALVIQGNTQIVKGDGKLAYNEKGLVGIAQNTVYNTVSTPKGGQYQLTLADGSKVWLNAASSIRFPTAFTGSSRVVEMTGEAYFEVAHDGSKPFIVSVNDMQVEVLGTHFNINSYSDEVAMKTTLLEGKVRLTRNGNMVVLKPGEQGITSRTTNPPSLTIIPSPDLDEVMAWRKGLFYFNRSSLQEVMTQIVRWYDVDVVYEGNVPERRFSGEISRNTNLSQVLKILEESKVHFAIENRKLIIRP